MFGHKKITGWKCAGCWRDAGEKVAARWWVTFTCPVRHKWGWAVCDGHKNARAAEVAAGLFPLCPEPACPERVSDVTFRELDRASCVGRRTLEVG